jgi:hypothetical protein
MFDSPFEFCAVCRAYVLLDQTQRECAHEHACAPAARCPLQRYFTGIDFAAAGSAGTPGGPAQPGRSRPPPLPRRR